MTKGMTKEELDHFKYMLLLKKKRLEGDMKTMQNSVLTSLQRDASGDITNIPTHMADVSGDTFEQDMTLGLLETDVGELHAIYGALERIDTGSFGLCEACGEPISKERLHHVPHARLCIACKRKEEEASDFWQSRY